MDDQKLSIFISRMSLLPNTDDRPVGSGEGWSGKGESLERSMSERRVRDATGTYADGMLAISVHAGHNGEIGGDGAPASEPASSSHACALGCSIAET